MGHLPGRLDGGEDPRRTHLHIWSFSVSCKEASVPLHITSHHPVLSPKLLSVAASFQEPVTFDQISSSAEWKQDGREGKAGSREPSEEAAGWQCHLADGRMCWEGEGRIRDYLQVSGFSNPMGWGCPKPLTEVRKSRCDSRQESGKTQFCLARLR